MQKCNSFHGKSVTLGAFPSGGFARAALAGLFSGLNVIIHGTEQIIRFERAARDKLTLMLLGCAFKVMAVTRLDTVSIGAPSDPFARVDLIQVEIPSLMY